MKMLQGRYRVELVMILKCWWSIAESVFVYLFLGVPLPLSRQYWSSRVLIFGVEPKGLLATARWISTKLGLGSSLRHRSSKMTARLVSMTARLFDLRGDDCVKWHVLWVRDQDRHSVTE